MKYAVVILAVALAITSYIAFRAHPEPENASFIKRRNFVLDSLNLQLTKTLEIELVKSHRFQARIDSLQKLKIKPVIIYVDKTKKIDSASAGYVLNDFSRIFADNGIK